MKKIILLILLSAGSFCAFAQTDTVKTKQPREEYCMIIATAKLFSTKVIITIDHGQETSYFGDKGVLKTDDGKVMSFNSVIDALNYMSTQGWYFVNAYALSEGSQGKVLNYVMRRPVK